MKRIITAVIAALTLTSCTSITKSKDGWTYTSFLNRKTIQTLEVTATGGIKMQGYESTQAENLKAVAEGVATGMGKAVVP